ncbi:MAG: HEAT repeat domain-containing protein [bacterium]|nr:HEAT repeat domain-containing protein [bacterium]
MDRTDHVFKCTSALSIWLLLQLLLTVAGAESGAEMEWRIRSQTSLRHIAMALAVANEPVDQLLRCDQEKEGKVTPVSAEKVFASVLQKLSMSEDLLVHGMYIRRIRPTDPDAKTAVGKWGSSYNTWCMSSERWKLAKHFWWYHDMKDVPLPFPILWDKRPDLCGETVPVLAIDRTTHSVPVRKLDAYLKAASQWVEPQTQPVEEILEMLRSHSVENRISAARLLGARKDAQYIPTIADCFKDPRLEVRRAAAWALGMIGGGEAISYLQANAKDSSSGVRGAVASALGTIGGPATVEPLAWLLKDAKPLVRKEAAAAMAATGSEKAVPYLVEALGDEDKATRQAALDSLIKLGWQPPKQETEPKK